MELKFKTLALLTTYLLLFFCLVFNAFPFSLSDAMGPTNESFEQKSQVGSQLEWHWYPEPSPTAIPLEHLNRTFGGPYDDWPDDVEVTLDGGYIIAGSTDPSGARLYDCWVVKTDMNGRQMWNKTYGGIGDDWASGIAVSPSIAEEEYIIAGWTNSSGAGEYDLWLIKTDVNGNQLWNKTYGGVRSDWANDIEIAPDGGFIVAGVTNSFGAADFWLLKVDANGNEQWNRTFGWAGTWDIAYDVEETLDGGYALAGYTYSNPFIRNFLLVKTDSNGNEQWIKSFGTGGMDMAFGVAVSADGGYTVIGSIFDPTNEVWLVKTDSKGNQEWNKTYSISGYDSAFDIESTPDKGYIIAGVCGYTGDFGLIKIDSKGAQQWVKTFGGSDLDRAIDVELTPGGGYIAVGDTFSFGVGGADFWLVRFKVHDRAVTYVKPSKTVVGQGYFVFINVTVENQGDYTETFNLTLYAFTMPPSIPIAMITVSNLSSGEARTVTYLWDTTEWSKGNYTIIAYADAVPDEVDTADNLLIDGWVVVAMAGDVAGMGVFPNTLPDGKVDIFDLACIASRYGVIHPDPRYIPNYDIDGNGKIDIMDLAIAAKNYGKIDP